MKISLFERISKIANHVRNMPSWMKGKQLNVRSYPSCAECGKPKPMFDDDLCYECSDAFADAHDRQLRQDRLMRS
jgi:hypothetical protein